MTGAGELRSLFEQSMEQRFAPDDYAMPTLRLCRRLLGSWLVHCSADGLCAGRIVEVEAYLGPHDKGAHSCGGAPTTRTAAMFGDKGRAYVYLIYGMYWCFNIVTGPPDKPQAILVRALEPVTGLDLMRVRHGRPHERDHALCQGPGKLCRALAISKEHYGEDLRGSRLFVAPGSLAPGERIATSPRIGIAYAEEYVMKPWRFYVRGNACVSGPAAMKK